jgi:CBS domain-containing protein
MRRDVVQFGPDDPLTLAAERLAQRQASAGVVVENGQVIGAISRLDIARLAEVLEAFPAAATRE